MFTNKVAFIYWNDPHGVSQALADDNIVEAEQSVFLKELFDTPLKHSVALPVQTNDDGKMFLLSISGREKRLIVNDHLLTTPEAFYNRVRLWRMKFAMIEAGEYRNGRLVRIPTVQEIARRLAYGLGSRGSKKVQDRDYAEIRQGLLQCVYFGHRLPLSLWQAALRQYSPSGNGNDADTVLAAVIKVAYIELIHPEINANAYSQSIDLNKQGDIIRMSVLDAKSQEPAYIAGRIFSFATTIQKRAHEYEINSNLVDRLFAEAKNNHRAVMANVIENVTKVYLRKIERRGDKGARDAAYLRDKFATLVESYDAAMSNVSAQRRQVDELLFVLGFHHELAYGNQERRASYDRAREREVRKAQAEADRIAQILSGESVNASDTSDAVSENASVV